MSKNVINQWERFCPSCGKNLKKHREGRACPKFEGKTVCVQCCNNCEDYDKDANGISDLWTCKYYTNRFRDYADPLDGFAAERIRDIKKRIEAAQ